MTFTIEITASPSLVKALETLAYALSGRQVQSTLEETQRQTDPAVDAVTEAVAEAKQEPVKQRIRKKAEAIAEEKKQLAEAATNGTVEEESAEETTGATTEEVTLAMVQHSLGLAMDKGKQAECKQIINSLGAAKVSLLDPSQYAECKRQFDAL